MNTENLSPVVEMMEELQVLKFLLYDRMKKLSVIERSLLMLDADLKKEYLIKYDKYYREVHNAKIQLEGLIDEELDAHIPTTIMWNELTTN